MLCLVHLVPPAPPPTPTGRRCPSPRLTADELRPTQAALRNMRERYGSAEKLALALGVSTRSVTGALLRGRQSAILFLRVAHLAGPLRADAQGRAGDGGAVPGVRCQARAVRHYGRSNFLFVRTGRILNSSSPFVAD